jgi:SpoVK/Ycf46/Vps4 family AAA+-type ATPase
MPQTIETDERRYLTEHVTIGDLVKPPVLLSSDLINMDRHALLGRWLFDEQQRCLHAVEILQLLYRRSVQPAPSAKSRDDKDTVDETACDRFQPIRFEPGTEECRLFFDTVVGMDDVKHQIRRGLIHPLVQPRLYPSTRLPNILLYGPPGTGKTHVMTAAANELQQTEGLRILVYSVTADQLKGAYFGESEKNIRALYDCASAAACRFQTPSTRVYAMVMIDEVDAVAPNRAVDNTGLAATTVNALLQVCA